MSNGALCSTSPQLLRMTNLVTALPASLVVNLLNEWLYVPDRVRLDSAFCQASVRGDCLELIRSPECTIRSWVFDQGEEKTTDQVTSWALRRSTLVDRVSIGGGSDLETYKSYLNKFGTAIVTARVWHTSLSDLTTSLIQCSNLTRIYCKHCEMSPSVRDVFVHCHNLREFRCTFHDQRYLHPPKSDTFTSEALQGVVCSNLRYMQLDVCDDEELVAAFLKMAVNLEHLDISFNSFSIDSLIDSVNPRIKTISLPEAPLSLDAVHRLVTRCPDIVNLGLWYCHVDVDMILEMGAHLSHLRALDLTSADDTGDDVLIAIADAFGTQLTELLLCQSYDMTLECAQQQLPRLPSLTTFTMHYDEEHHEIFDFTLLQNLTVLSIVYSGQENAHFVLQIAHHCCAKLQRLSLTLFDCATYPIAELDLLVSKCTQLRTIGIATEGGTVYSAGDVVRWQTLRPGLVVPDKIPEKMRVLWELEQGWE